MDLAVNELLESKTDNPKLSKASPLKRAQFAFIKEWLPYKFATNIEYAKKDLDVDLFTMEDLSLIKGLYPDEEPLEFIHRLIQLRNEQPSFTYVNMEPNAKIAYNFVCWLCLSIKANYLLEAYDNEIMPQIRRVISIQKEVVLENTQGDSVTGAIDFIAELDDGHTYIIDNKTCSTFGNYPQGCVESSEQLALYGFSEGINKGAYIAMLKNVSRDKRKKDSVITAKIRIIKGDIVPEFQQDVVKMFNIVNKDIKQGIFIKKQDQKDCWQYGRPCPFYKKCWENSDEGLYIKEFKEKK